MDLMISEEHGGLEGEDGSSGLETNHTANDARYVAKAVRPAGVFRIEHEVVDPPPDLQWEVQYVAPMLIGFIVRRVNGYVFSRRARNGKRGTSILGL